MGEKKRAKERARARKFGDVPGALNEGDWVVTNSGEKGQILELSEDEDTALIRWDRSPSSPLSMDLGFLTRTEPPYGWPVVVKDDDGNPRWLMQTLESGGNYADWRGWILSWENIVEREGIPALIGEDYYSLRRKHYSLRSDYANR